MKKWIAGLLLWTMALGLSGCSREGKEIETTTTPPEVTTAAILTVEEAGVPVEDPQAIAEAQVFLNRFYYNRAFGQYDHETVEEGAILEFAAFWAEKFMPAACERLGDHVYIPRTVIETLAEENFGQTLPKDLQTGQVTLSGEEYVVRSYAYSDMTFCTVTQVLECADGRGKIMADIGSQSGTKLEKLGNVSLYYERTEEGLHAVSYRIGLLEDGEKIPTEGVEPDAEVIALCTDLYMNPAFYNGSLGQVTDDTARLYALYEAVERGAYTEDAGDYVIPAETLHGIAAETFGRPLKMGYAGEARIDGDTYRVDSAISTTLSRARYLEFDEMIRLSDGTWSIGAEVFVGDAGEGNSTHYTDLRFRLRETGDGYVLLEMADSTGDLSLSGVASAPGEETLHALMEQMFFSPAFGFCTEETISAERAEYFAVDYYVEHPNDDCFADYAAGIMFIPEAAVDRAAMAWFGIDLENRGLGDGYSYNAGLKAYEGEFIGRPSLYMLLNKTVEEKADGIYILRADIAEPDWEDPEGKEAARVGMLEIWVDGNDAQPRVLRYQADRSASTW